MEHIDDYNKDVLGDESNSYTLGALVECRSEGVTESQHLSDLLNDSKESSSVDVNERYVRDEVIGESDTAKTTDLFALLSAELNNDQYLIRTPGQQAEWTKNKSYCQKELAKYMLRFSTVRDALIVACDNTSGSSHLLGILKETEDGTAISYPKDLPDEVKELVVEYQSGKSCVPLEDVVDLIVDTYNLSYAHFIKQQAERLIKEYNLVLKARINISDLAQGTTADLFPSERTAIDIFSDKQEVTPPEAKHVMRCVRLLSSRIKELRNRLVSTNLRSCINSAMKFFHKGGGNKLPGLNYMDLISEGAEGLMHACDMYFHGSNAKFTTYADYWVKLKISRHIKNNNSIKIPIHATDLVNKILNSLRNWDEKDEDARIPSREEVELKLEETIPDVIWELAMNRYNNIPVNISCVNTHNGEDEVSFDVFKEVRNESEDHVIQTEYQKVIEIADRLLDGGEMTPRQYKVLELKFIGERTHAEIAKELGNGCTDKTVRSESKKALDLIRIELGIIPAKRASK
jgi:RNA polymerase primary sigma factor